MNKLLILIILFSSVFFTGCVSKYNNCTEIKTGSFYYYVKPNYGEYLILRSDTIQKEILVSKKDTAIWKIKWINECTYSATFISSNSPMSETESYFYAKYIGITEIISINKDYYIV